MINFDELRKEYEDLTNIHLYNEEGELVDFYREINTVKKPVCGIWHINPVTITAVNKPFCGIATVDIHVLSHVGLWEATRKAMNDAAELLNGTNKEMADEDTGKPYSVSYNLQTAAVGNRILDANVGHGEVIEIIQHISYVIIESGVSAYETKLYIDGIRVPFLSLVENKIHTTSVMPSRTGIAQSASEQEAYGIDFVGPLMKDDLGIVLHDIIKRSTGNEAHCVVLEKGGYRSCHIMQFTQEAANVQPPQNVGVNLSMAEIHPTVAKLNGMWAKTTATKPIALIYANQWINDTDVRSIVVFWGDDTAEAYTKETESAMHVYTDGEATHEILVYLVRDSHYKPITAGVDLYGKRIYFRYPEKRIYAEVLHPVTNAGGKILVTNGKSGADARQIRIVKSTTKMYFDQNVSSRSVKFGREDATDAKGWYVENNESIVCAVDVIESVDEIAKDFMYYNLQDIECGEVGIYYGGI